MIATTRGDPINQTQMQPQQVMTYPQVIQNFVVLFIIIMIMFKKFVSHLFFIFQEILFHLISQKILVSESKFSMQQFPQKKKKTKIKGMFYTYETRFLFAFYSALVFFFFRFKLDSGISIREYKMCHDYFKTQIATSIKGYKKVRTQSYLCVEFFLMYSNPSPNMNFVARIILMLAENHVMQVFSQSCTKTFYSMIKSCYPIARFYVRKMCLPKKSCYGKSFYGNSCQSRYIYLPNLKIVLQSPSISIVLLKKKEIHDQ